MQSVVDAARLNGWLVYHTHDSRRSAEGFPDLVMLRLSRMVVAELKTPTGKVTPAQAVWLEAFRDVYDGPIEVFVWRPADWPAIEKTLR